MVSLLRSIQDHADDVNWCGFSSTLLATCSLDKSIRIYSSTDFTEASFSPLAGHGYGVHCCCFSSCGRYLASCSTDATTVVWGMSSGEKVAVFEQPGRSPVRVCMFSPGSACLVSGASDGSIALWDFQSRGCQVSPICGLMFVTDTTYGDMQVWDLDANQLHAAREAHDLGVTCCHFAPQIHSDDHSVWFRLASCGQDSLLKIWTVSQHATGCRMELLHTLTGQSAPVLSCSFSADGGLLAGVKWLCDLATFQNSASLLYSLHQHQRYVTACAFSPTMPLLATGSMDRSVIIWRVEDGSGGQGVLTSCPLLSVCSILPGRCAVGRSSLPVSRWSEEDVLAWLREEGLAALESSFRANNIDGAELLCLDKEMLTSDLRIESAGLRSKVLRKIEEMKTASDDSCVPDELLCPITREVLRDPVIAADGYSYEREAIESWVRNHNRSSPMTNLPLLTMALTPNRTLKMAISRWKAAQ
uniref:WD repeat, SAM and U-box domain-containing protein 1 n=1 Tax=Paramormyrops kingsleyae TaxID=1676925 RepID=A0A3B3SP33_9TELE